MTPARDILKLSEHTYQFLEAEKMAARMMKREHAAIVRAVKRLQNGSQRRRLTYERLDGYVMACEDVLALLAQRKDIRSRHKKPQHFFTGQLDEMRIFEKALTPAEAQQIIKDKLTGRYRKNKTKALLAGRKERKP